MMDFFINNGATILISGLLLAVVFWIVSSMFKKRKRGKSIGCSCGCGSCPSASLCQGQDKKDHPADQ